MNIWKIHKKNLYANFMKLYDEYNYWGDSNLVSQDCKMDCNIFLAISVCSECWHYFCFLLALKLLVCGGNFLSIQIYDRKIKYYGVFVRRNSVLRMVKSLIHFEKLSFNKSFVETLTKIPDSLLILLLLRVELEDLLKGFLFTSSWLKTFYKLFVYSCFSFLNNTHRERLVFHLFQYRDGWLAASDLLICLHNHLSSIHSIISTDVWKKWFIK